MSTKPYIFLSHSSKDKAFVNKLDAALVVSNQSTFLDEKHIKPGDSIPRKLYEALDKATHIIYVISKNSIAAPWVNEELDVAKMRVMGEGGVTIIPILIDETEPPIAVRHIKYLKCLGWDTTAHFTKLARELLHLLDCVPLATGAGDISFYAACSDLQKTIFSDVSMFTSYFECAATVRYYNGADHPTDVGNWLFRKLRADNEEVFQRVINNLESMEMLFAEYSTNKNDKYPKTERMIELVGLFREAFAIEYNADYKAASRAGFALLRALEEVESEYRAITLMNVVTENDIESNEELINNVKSKLFLKLFNEALKDNPEDAVKSFIEMMKVAVENK